MTLHDALSAFALPTFNPGEVWLSGAGPGDPGLLTLHAVNALGQADIILYDALVDKGVLDLARPELAREGRRVLRLKGGDPFVFGRGGEEALGLVAAGIAFRVIPGVTAGLGGLAYANIPATTRDTNHGVILVTGQYAAGNERRMDWAAVAQTKLPVILYMGMSRLPEIADALLAGGMPPDLPVAIVNNATTPRQRVFVTTLARAGVDAAAQGFGAPSIIAIGEMVRLREALSPFAITLTAKG
jgi:uroporphyrin-III C-methyltransferase